MITSSILPLLISLSFEGLQSADNLSLSYFYPTCQRVDDVLDVKCCCYWSCCELTVVVISEDRHSSSALFNLKADLEGLSNQLRPICFPTWGAEERLSCWDQWAPYCWKFRDCKAMCGGWTFSHLHYHVVNPSSESTKSSYDLSWVARVASEVRTSGNSSRNYKPSNLLLWSRLKFRTASRRRVWRTRHGHLNVIGNHNCGNSWSRDSDI